MTGSFEGCRCGHGQYQHYGSYAQPLGSCFVAGCDCGEFRRRADDEFGISLDPCEHPSVNGGVCAVCGAVLEEPGEDIQRGDEHYYRMPPNSGSPSLADDLSDEEGGQS